MWTLFLMCHYVENKIFADVMNKNIMPYLSAYAVLLVGVVALLLSYPKAEHTYF